MRKAGRISYRITEGLIFFVSFYAFCALALPQITINSDFTDCDRDAVSVFIRTNGVHTDVVVPFRNEIADWSQFVKPSDTKGGDTSAAYVAFGWGDKGFYLGTKTWADLKFSVAFKAAFFLSSTAMHVTFCDQIVENGSCIRICIDKTHYQQLVDFIRNSFTVDADGQPELIKDASYFNTDAFYEAKGTYGFTYTCNTWANIALMNAGAKCCLWTPFDKGIFCKYRIKN